VSVHYKGLRRDARVVEVRDRGFYRIEPAGRRKVDRLWKGGIVHATEILGPAVAAVVPDAVLPPGLRNIA
jgi:hypothetical protein